MNALIEGVSRYRGRLAPTPSGRLHLGHASTFSIAAARSLQSGGELILRMEDLDSQRCRPEFFEGVIEDLKWWGLQWCEGPDCGGDYGPYVQSQRLTRYREVWRELVLRGWIYPSSHSRKDVERALSAPHAGEETAEPIFPRELRGDPKKFLETSEPGEVNWRFAVPDDFAMSFVDGRAGVVESVSGVDFGDFLVWRKDGFPSYELAVVVDDHDMRITEVVRGEDLLTSTFRQLLIYQALGWSIPDFYHAPLIKNSQGERLAKRDPEFTLQSFRERGISPAELIQSHLPELAGGGGKNR